MLLTIPGVLKGDELALVRSWLAAAFDVHHCAYPMFWYTEASGRFGNECRERKEG